MKAIVINPYLRTINQTLLVDGNDIETLYRSMTWLEHKVDTVTIGMILPNGDNLILDDNGALFPNRRVWKFNGQPFVGVGVLLGSNDDGDWIEPKTGLVDLQSYCSWTDLVTTGELK